MGIGYSNNTLFVAEITRVLAFNWTDIELVSARLLTASIAAVVVMRFETGAEWQDALVRCAVSCADCWAAGRRKQTRLQIPTGNFLLSACLGDHTSFDQLCAGRAGRRPLVLHRRMPVQHLRAT